jgi:hypothetical protein
MRLSVIHLQCRCSICLQRSVCFACVVGVIMGVPKFFRWVSERYPCLSEVVREYQVLSVSKCEIGNIRL